MGAAPPHVAFVLESHLGHRTYADNVRAGLEGRADVRATWIDVDYAPSGRWFERIPSEAVRGALRGRTTVNAALGAVEPDVCVFNTQVPAVIAGRIARRRPYVLCTDVTPRQYDRMAGGYGHHADRTNPLGWAKHRWNRSVLARAAAHAPWSAWVRDSLVEEYGVDPSRIEVIPPGVDLQAWRVAEHAGDGPVRLLFVGGHFERKGGLTLLRAMAALSDLDVEATVVTRSDVPRQPRVTTVQGLVSNDDRLRSLFASSDVFVLPSNAETFGIAAVEAAASGLPAVVSTTGALGELVTDGVTGYAVAPEDDVALAAALRALVEHPERRRAMGRAGRARAEREFDARINASRLVDLAVSCTERAPRAAPRPPGAPPRGGPTAAAPRSHADRKRPVRTSR